MLQTHAPQLPTPVPTDYVAVIGACRGGFDLLHDVNAHAATSMAACTAACTSAGAKCVSASWWLSGRTTFRGIKSQCWLSASCISPNCCWHGHQTRIKRSRVSPEVLNSTSMLLASPVAASSSLALPSSEQAAQQLSHWPPDVPRVIHVCYKTSVIPAVVKHKWLSLNPTFAFVVHSDAECLAFVRRHFGDELAHFYETMPAPQLKACMWRVMYLYVHGGVYSDVDVEPVRPLHEIVRPGDRFVTVGSQASNLMNPILLVARRGEPVLNLTLHEMLRRYRTTTYHYLDWSSCRTVYDALSLFFAPDEHATRSWAKHCRGGGVLWSTPPWNGTYRILTSMRPTGINRPTGETRERLVLKYNNEWLFRLTQQSPWTFSGNTLVLFDKWHRSVWVKGGAFSTYAFSRESTMNGTTARSTRLPHLRSGKHFPSD